MEITWPIAVVMLGGLCVTLTIAVFIILAIYSYKDKKLQIERQRGAKAVFVSGKPADVKSTDSRGGEGR